MLALNYHCNAISIEQKLNSSPSYQFSQHVFYQQLAGGRSKMHLICRMEHFSYDREPANKDWGPRVIST